MRQEKHFPALSSLKGLSSSLTKLNTLTKRSRAILSKSGENLLSLFKDDNRKQQHQMNLTHFNNTRSNSNLNQLNSGNISSFDYDVDLPREIRSNYIGSRTHIGPSFGPSTSSKNLSYMQTPINIDKSRSNTVLDQFGIMTSPRLHGRNSKLSQDFTVIPSQCDSPRIERKFNLQPNYVHPLHAQSAHNLNIQNITSPVPRRRARNKLPTNTASTSNTKMASNLSHTHTQSTSTLTQNFMTPGNPGSSPKQINIHYNTNNTSNFNLKINQQVPIPINIENIPLGQHGSVSSARKTNDDKKSNLGFRRSVSANNIYINSSNNVNFSPFSAENCIINMSSGGDNTSDKKTTKSGSQLPDDQKSQSSHNSTTPSQTKFTKSTTSNLSNLNLNQNLQCLNLTPRVFRKSHQQNHLQNNTKASTHYSSHTALSILNDFNGLNSTSTTNLTKALPIARGKSESGPLGTINKCLKKIDRKAFGKICKSNYNHECRSFSFSESPEKGLNEMNLVDDDDKICTTDSEQDQNSAKINSKQNSSQLSISSHGIPSSISRNSDDTQGRLLGYSDDDFEAFHNDVDNNYCRSFKYAHDVRFREGIQGGQILFNKVSTRIKKSTYRKSRNDKKATKENRQVDFDTSNTCNSLKQQLSLKRSHSYCDINRPNESLIQESNLGVGVF